MNILQVTWNVIETLLHDHLLIEDVPINCVREVFEKHANAKFEIDSVIDGSCTCILKVRLIILLLIIISQLSSYYL